MIRPWIPSSGGVQVQKEEQINWEQRRYELAKEAMMSMINTNAVTIRRVGITATKARCLAGIAVKFADALISELRGDNHDLDK